MLDTIGRYFKAATNVLGKMHQDGSSLGACFTEAGTKNHVGAIVGMLGAIGAEAQKLKHKPEEQVLAAS